MSTDEIEVIKPIIKSKRKYTRRKKIIARAPPVVPKPTAEFAGLTVTDCAKGCSPAGCVISGRGYCAHPRKGALQAIDMQNVEALARLNRARKQLGINAVEQRFG